jgi:Mg2+/Co2+ transporter CorB
MSWKLPTDGPKTLNGLIIEYLEDIPENNISLRLAGYPIEIIEVSGNKIKTIRVMPEYFMQNQEESG